MAETLYIENFGPIKKAELDLRQAIVLIGPQSSGKSAIAKLISILRDWRFVNTEAAFETLLENFNVLSFLSSRTIIRYNSRSHGFRYEKGAWELIFDTEHRYFKAQEALWKYEEVNPKPPFDEHLEHVKKQLAEASRLGELAKKTSGIEQSDLLGRAEKIHQDVSKELDILEERQRMSNEIRKARNQFTNYSQYIPAERILIPIYSSSPLGFINSNLPIPKNILEFGAAFERAKQSTPKFKIPFMNFSYSFESGTDIVYFNEKEGAKLKESSSGLQTLIPMLLVVIDKWTNEEILYSFVVEEPEQNLYPLAQQKLVYFLSDRCLQHDEKKCNRSDLVITTHSPYILTSFNNLLFADLVAQKEENKTAVSKIIPEESRINAENFNAYYVANGTVEQIFNRDTGLISENQLDSAIEEIMFDFNSLMDIYKNS